MEYKKQRKALRLLPRYFKTIGLVLIILALVTVIVKVSLHVQLLPWQKKWGFILVTDLLILGMFLIAISKDKIEDEMIMSIRLQAMAGSFISGVVTVLVKPFIDLLFKNLMTDYTGQQLVLNMLLFYLIIYYFQKRRR